MQKLPLILAGAVALTLPAAAQVIGLQPNSNAHLKSAAWQDQDDRQRRDDDDYYRRDREYKRGDRDRDRDDDRGRYGRNGYGQYHNVLAPEWQQKFDSYYQRWLQARSANNTNEMASMEKRMQDIMVHYNIPSNVPYDQVASPGMGGYYGNPNGGYYGNGRYGRGDQGGYYGRGGYGQYHNVLAPEWQQKFDSYYQRWLQYQATNNRSEMASMEKRMQDIMVHYNIPTNTPYDQVASPGVGRRY